MAIDIFGLPDSTDNFQIFHTNGSTSWQMWTKPRNCKLVNILAIGGGGGGAGGASGASVNRLAGAGGACSGISRGVFPANMLPDILYVQVGVGGAGGGSATYGSPGTLSYISVEPETTPAFVLLASGAAGAGGGGGAAINTPGIAGTVFSQTNYNLSYIGVLTLIAGANGATGGIAGGAGGTATGNIITQPGAGGGGSTNVNGNGAGGGITVQGNLIPVLIAGGSAGSSAAAQSGIKVLTPSINSLGIRLPFYNSGGAGGGGNGAGTGGRGGDGAFGSGGGGGGAGTIGGTGGNGGDGIVIITSY